MTATWLVERDSVCMADDIDAPHAQAFDLDAADALAAVRAVAATGYLPGVAGGATWIAYTDRRPIAVVTVSAWLSRRRVWPVHLPPVGSPGRLSFAYYLANDPQRLLAALDRGETPERRHGPDLRR